MNHTKILTDIVASEIVSSNMKQSQKTFDEVVESMNLKILAERVRSFHDLQVSDADMVVCIIGAVATAQISLFPDSFVLNGLTETFH